MTPCPPHAAQSMICVCLCSVIEQFTVNDLDRSEIEHSTDLDNRVRQPNDCLISQSKVKVQLSIVW